MKASIPLVGIFTGILLSITSISWLEAQNDLKIMKPGDTLTDPVNYDFYLNVFLEGPFDGAEMSTEIFDSGKLPLNQPYNVSPWDYNGTETLALSPDADAVDWVFLEFRKTTHGPAFATPETIVYRCAAILMSNGTVADIFGFSPLLIPVDKENVYIVVYHRNHLAAMSDSPVVPWSPQGYGYDFTDQPSKAYLDGQKEIAPGIFGMIGGDCDANGKIETVDKNVCWSPEAGNNGYLPGDWNLDLQVNNPDKDDIWLINMGLESKVPRAFVCGELLTDFRDDQTYETVLIGNQCWFKENMNIGDFIPVTQSQLDNGTIEKYCYNNDTANCTTYGGLYQWNEMMQYSTDPTEPGICPVGWHIPTDYDMQVLEGNVDTHFGVGDPIWNSSGFRGFDAGKNLRSSSGWLPGGNEVDYFGFALLPGGWSAGSSFAYLGSYAYLHTSTEGTSSAWYRMIDRTNNNIYKSLANHNFGFSVRCMRNNLQPDQLQYLLPENGAMNQSTDIILSWSCTDTDNDPLSFDLYFGTNSNPSLFAEGISDFSYRIENLECNTSYYWKIIAYDNHQNQTSGPVWNFTTTWKCGCTLTDQRDGQTYNTVIIGNQCWMSENMNIGDQVDGLMDQTDNSLIEKCCYDDLESNCDVFGGLYQWNEMMQYDTAEASEGICPEEWYVPANTDWNTLINYLGGNSLAGGKMKETGTARWDPPNTGATNESGFAALPAGYRNAYGGSFNSLGQRADFWTSSDSIDIDYSWKYELYYNIPSINFAQINKSFGQSVRCIWENTPPGIPFNPSPTNGALEQETQIVLSWSCVDQQNDPLTFDLYFGTESDPPLFYSGITAFSFEMGMVDYSKTYYWKIVARDINDYQVEGPVWNFTTKPWECGLPLFDIRDEKLYNTILIDTQCWMAENLNIGNKIIGIAEQQNNQVIEKYCYNNAEESCSEYGGLYQWNEALQCISSESLQGICPPGWYIPSDTEWDALTSYLGGLDIAGGKMKETGTSHWNPPNTGATNESGFTALPGGYLDSDGSNYYIRNWGFYWTSTEDGPNDAWARLLRYNTQNVDIEEGEKSSIAFSVRCIKNNNLAPEIPSNPYPENGAINIPANLELSWDCTDPESEILEFDLYFGNEPNPPLFAENLTSLSYPIENLNCPNFYWKITVNDGHNNIIEGPVWHFSTAETWNCGCSFQDTRDGQWYNTVSIGEQCWMAENLNIGLQVVTNVIQSDNDVLEKYCYDNNQVNCNQYGGLYSWDEMMQYTNTEQAQGICPDGWYIPAESNWCTTTQYIDPTANCGLVGWTGTDGGTKMKSTYGWYMNGNGTNISGFTGLPAGIYDYDEGSYDDLTRSTRFWSSSEIESNTGWTWGLQYNYSGIKLDQNFKINNYSVRCVKVNLPPDPPSDPSPPDGAINQPVNIELSWTCSDPENNPITYDIYFGFESNPPLLISDITESYYSLVSLTKGVTYYWKIVATDSFENTTIGPVWKFNTLFNCGDTIYDTRDGQYYGTVLIDNQCWMSENLNVGTLISYIGNQNNNGIIEKYCFNNSDSWCEEYGGLYQWNEMMQYNPDTLSGICPNGWRIPTDEEWKILEGNVDSQYGYPDPEWDGTGYRGLDVGLNLKSTSGWNSGGNGIDLFGFTALPAGSRSNSGGMLGNGIEADFWSSSENNICRLFNYVQSTSRRELGAIIQNAGLSVRCLLISTPVPENPSPSDNAQSIPANIYLTWKCQNPNNYILTYDLLLTDSINFLINVSDLSEALYNPGLLEYYTTYYWRITVHDNYGDFSEGPVWHFTTHPDGPWECGYYFSDERDGQIYATTQIGDQCWMAENLNTGSMIETILDQTDNSILEKYCYDNIEAYCDIYGGLYQWNELMEYNTIPSSQGICPDGWHIPTNNEWKYLEGTVDSQYPVGDTIWNQQLVFRGFDAGKNLKSTFGWYNNGNGTDLFNFSVLPSGYFINSGTSFSQYGLANLISTSTLYIISTQEMVRRIRCWEDGVWHIVANRYDGVSVRCLKYMNPNQVPNMPSNPTPPDGTNGALNNSILSWSCSDPENDPITYDIYFGTNPNPPIIITSLMDTVYDPGELKNGITYFWKIIVQDDHGNYIEGPVWSFTTIWECGNDLVDERDGSEYSTVLIDDQCWMAENLNIGIRIDGTENQLDNGTIEKYCFVNLEDNCDLYGGFYQWNEIMQYNGILVRGICPFGWHIPTDLEWCDMTKYLNPNVDCDAIGWGGGDVGIQMKSTSGWIGGNNGTNSSGFNALPCGFLNGAGSTSPSYCPLGNAAWYWSATGNSGNAWNRKLSWNSPNIGRDYISENYWGLSVRCVKDTINQPPDPPSNPNPVNGSTDIEINVSLSWNCSDPDGNDLFYNIYFDTIPIPGLYMSMLIEPSFTPNLINYNTTYYWQVIAFDCYGDSAVSDIWSFTTIPGWECEHIWIDDRDGNVYNTIQIGDQCWMMENLNIGSMIDGSGNQTNNSIIEKYCYNNISDSCLIYGGLYQWNEMMQYTNSPAIQGICPDEWHIPTDNEWKYLEGMVDTQYDVGDTLWNTFGFRGYDAGGNLKESGLAHWTDPNAGATNSSGFTAYPGGYRYISGDFYNLNTHGNFWTSSENDNSTGDSRYLTYDNDKIYRNNYDKDFGFSVRCLRYTDLSNQPPDQPNNLSPENGINIESVNIQLSWFGSDPDDDPLIYDIYFGPDPNPPLVERSLMDTIYDPGELIYDSTYYWKIVAQDDHGNLSSSPIMNFTTLFCSGTLIDFRDGQTYNTIKIGYQCWMVENLNVGDMIQGISNSSNNGIIEKYCQNNLDEYCDIYGGLYQWNEMMNYVTTPGIEGICPPGWHLPSDDEWCILENYVDVDSISCSSINMRGIDAGGNIKETGTLHWVYPNTGATNTSGFTSLPGGLRNVGGTINNINYNAYFWSSSQQTSYAWFRHLSAFSAQITRGDTDKAKGLSVRCLKANFPPDQPFNPSPVDESINQPNNLVLSWECLDPENDPITFDIYFGSVSDPPILYEGITDYSYDPGTLNDETTYYWRIVAKDNHGNFSTGPVWQFTTFICGYSIVDPRDSKIYNTVPIGNQCWMAENMNIGNRIEAAWQQSNNGNFDKYCYNNLEDSCDVYGGLYQWNEAMQYSTVLGSQGICPPGWHIPTNDEWDVLQNFLGGSTIAGGKMKETGTSHWYPPNTGATNESGFTGLPGGQRQWNGGTFSWLGNSGDFWSSNSFSSYAYFYILSNSSIELSRIASYKTYGLSVRCLRD